MASFSFPSLHSGAAGRAAMYAAVALGAAAVAGLFFVGQERLAVAVGAMGLFLIIASVNINAAILCVVAYVSVLGDLRRFMIYVADWSGSDPMLAVSGAAAALLVVGALAARRQVFEGTASKWALALSVVMLLQIANPVQGGIAAGIAGALFLFVPVLWFWVGRAYGSEALVQALLLRVVLPVGVGGAAMGIYQTFNGYLPHQLVWVEDNWYAGLGDPANPSPISLFASNTEYGTFMALCAAVAWGAFLRGHRTFVLLVPLYLSAILLTGVRGPVLFSLAAMVLMWAAIGRTLPVQLGRAGMAAVMAATALAWGLGQSASLGLDENVQTRLDRQADQFTSEGRSADDYSSAGKHSEMILNGYRYALETPLGRGLGYTTQAAGRFGAGGFSTEHSLGDSFLGLGIPGGIAYHLFVIFVTVAMWRVWFRRRDLTAMLLLGVVFITYANWLSGGLYAVSTIALFCVGSVVRFHEEDKAPPEPVYAPTARRVRPRRESAMV